MKCQNCNQEIDLKEVKQKLINELLKTEWKQIILNCANISTVGAEDIANVIKSKFSEIVNKTE